MKSKQVLSIEQMQHLQELGLELDYDTLYQYVKFEDTDWLLKPFSDLNIIGISCKYIPAYTLQDVLDALPRFVIDEEGYKYYLQIEMMNTEFDDWRISYKSVGQDESPLGYFQAFQLIDAAVRMLVLCYENGYVETTKNE